MGSVKSLLTQNDTLNKPHLLVGVSSKGLAISEKHSDEPFGDESRVGIPFNFLMRDVLQFDESLQDSIRCECKLEFLLSACKLIEMYIMAYTELHSHYFRFTHIIGEYRKRTGLALYG